MKFSKFASVAVMIGALAVGGASAQTTSPGDQPAEFPPSSYKGKQYVDSRGCVFIRAGIDGTVSWIPRVGRDRKGVCGFKPSLGAQTAAAKPAPAPAVAPIRITNPAPAAVAVKPAPVTVAAAPKPRVVAAPKPRPAVVRQTAPVRRAPAPKPVVVKPAPVVVQQPARGVTARAASACPNASAFSQRYINSGTKHEVRCGPQQRVATARTTTKRRGLAGLFAPRRVAPAAPVLAPAVAPAATGTIVVSPNRRIVPRHVAINRVNTTNVKVPRGYKRVWKDDRLNPRRAEQTLAGHRQMQLVWTSTVPRRLINQASGQDVTASVALVYPYTNFERQQRELGQVTFVRREGQLFKRVLRNLTTPRRVARAPAAPTTVYSSRSTPKQVVTTAPVRAQTKKTRARVKQPMQTERLSGKRYVQVGTFGDAATAQRSAKKIQRLGFPVRVGRYDRSGQTLRIVVVGPFGSDTSLSSALGRVRGAGFGSAFARK